MRVLLLHEMSGVHTELRRGLRELGIDARIATFGDGFKRYPSDIDLGRTGQDVASVLGRVVRQVWGAREWRGFDVIQTISPDPFFRPIAAAMERYVFAEGGKCVYVAAGSDAIYRRHVRSLDYHPPHAWYEDASAYRRLHSMLSRFARIVPVCWEYMHAMHAAGLPATDVVPFPIDLSRHAVRPTGRGSRIRFFHPLNRVDLAYDFKGTKLILEAFKRLERMYGDVAEFVSAGGMDHAAYDAFTEDVDVIVDQVYSYSYGMSAAYGLAKGKVVLSGLEAPARTHGFYLDCPVINLRPDVTSIVETIGGLIERRAGLAALGERSRAFAECHHDHLRVAELYAGLYARSGSPDGRA